MATKRINRCGGDYAVGAAVSNELPTFGVGVGISVNEWRSVLRQLVTQAQFLAIDGVGPKKCEEYAEVFIAEIQRFGND